MRILFARSSGANIDTGASSVSLVPTPTTIAALTALVDVKGSKARVKPTETTLWELKDVALTLVKGESDSDYHMVLTDGSHTLIAEIPYPTCANGSAWSCFISRARSNVDAKLSPSSGPQYPSLTVTVRGVGFFDASHDPPKDLRWSDRRCANCSQFSGKKTGR